MNKGKVFLVMLSKTDDSVPISEEQSGSFILIRATFLQHQTEGHEVMK